ncbi:hypothetical protein HY214_01560, partial [Candidatus Roizmanbacteria bacterium]|nr:hypothetical protein [Candidatus Roizmanbacteria bacterium]
SALFWTGCIVTSVLLFYNPLSSVKTGSALVASPFAIVHAMIEERSLIYLPKLVNARYYLYTIGWGPRLLAIELFSTVLFFLFNFGTRTAGLLYAFLLIIRKKSSIFDLTLFLTVVFAATLPVIFIQKGIWWNTIQFFYYATFIANYFTAKLLARLLTGKKMVFLVLVAVIVGLTIPENFDIIQGFNVLRPYSYIPQSELEALRFLKKRPSGVVFASPWEQVTKERLRTTPLYEAVDSGYVAAYSAHQLYYADSHVLSIIGVDFKKRQERITKKDCTVLSEVTYIYRQNKNTTDLLMTCQGYLDQHFSPIFNNSVISIYQQR